MNQRLGITIDELCQFVELKCKMKMTMSGTMDESCFRGQERDKVLKIGDVTKSYGDYYVVLDVSVDESGKTVFYGAHMRESNNDLKITEGATYFYDCPEDYVRDRIGMNIIQLRKKIRNKAVMNEINELETKIAELQKQLV